MAFQGNNRRWPVKAEQMVTAHRDPDVVSDNGMELADGYNQGAAVGAASATRNRRRLKKLIFVWC